jgi:hypothetical protein
MRRYKLDVQTGKPSELLAAVFGKQDVALGESVETDGIEITNLTGNTKGITAGDLLSFAIELKANIAGGVIAAFIYDLCKAGVTKLLINGKDVEVDKKTLEAEIEKNDDGATK